MKNETTNTSVNLYSKLAIIQSKIKGLSKDSKSHNYDYVSGNKILSFIKPLMDEHKLILKQEVLELINERQDYKTKYGEKSEILSKVMMRFTWVDCETGEKDENLFAANGQNDWEKGLGSALTYGERYFLLKFFHISTDEDDIDNPKRKPNVESAPVAKDKPALTQKVVDKCIDRINKGEENIVENIENHFICKDRDLLFQLVQAETLYKESQNE